MNDPSDHGLDPDELFHEPFEATTTQTPAGQALNPLDFDLNCIRCGYNLRGTLPQGHCPECGEPVDTTLRPDLLHLANHHWLSSLSGGMNWLIVAIIANLAMIPVGLVIGFASAASSTNSSTMPTATLLILGLMGLIVSALYGVGVWRVTTPEPDVIQNKPARSMARWLIVPAMLLGLLPELFNISASPSTNLVGAVIDTISSIMLLVGFLAGLIYLRSLASRIPEPSLAKQTTTVFWGYLVSMSTVIVLAMAMAIVAFLIGTSANSSASAGIMGVLGILMCPLGLAMLVFFIWFIVLMFRYRTRFSQAHQIAIQTSQ